VAMQANLQLIISILSLIAIISGAFVAIWKAGAWTTRIIASIDSIKAEFSEYKKKNDDTICRLFCRVEDSEKRINILEKDIAVLKAGIEKRGE
jgi:hypothetical protein